MTRAFSIVLLLAFFAAVVGRAEPDPDPARAVARAAADMLADIVSAEKELAGARAEIDGEARPLAARLEALRTELAALRQARDRARALNNASAREMADLAKQTAQIEAQHRFILSVLAEYRRAAPGQAGPADGVAVEQLFAAADTLLTDRDDFVSLPAAAASILHSAEIVNLAGLETAVREGVAVDSAGVERRGVLVTAGPAACFAAQDGASGMVIQEPGSLLPSFTGVPGFDITDIVGALRAGGECVFPVDPTGTGAALKAARADRSLGEHLRSGGPVMIPLGLVALFAFAAACWKIAQLSRMPAHKPIDTSLIARLARQGDPSAALEEAGRAWAPLNRVLQAAVDFRDVPREHLEEVVNERVLSELPSLERHLGTLSVLGAVAPLLGLLGTVTGMIHTFQLVTVFGTGEARLLSDGLSEALVTTEAGLVIAIPVLLVHAWLARRVRSVLGSLEQTALRLINELKQQAPRP
ncbi:MAG: hypothetical protein FJ224_06465 [Lentisphaerae bacterium]|nr:hypothetical protein [Lentisphaerota bacterium]